MQAKSIALQTIGVLSLMMLFGCPREEPDPEYLDTLSTADITVGDQPFKVWLATSARQQNRGLMFVTEEEMAPLDDGTERGMLFVFSSLQTASFWMKDTIIGLDIAYIDENGQVISVHTMRPLDERFNAYPPGGSYRYALEVNSGRLEQLGIKPGETIPLPDAIGNP